MLEPSDINLEDWLNRWDIQSVPDVDDKVRECEFFFGQLAVEVARVARVGWVERSETHHGIAYWN